MLTDEMKAAGWIEHDGGPCPVDKRRKVLVLLGSGKITREFRSGGSYRWGQDKPPHACDIIAYKPETPHD